MPNDSCAFNINDMEWVFFYSFFSYFFFREIRTLYQIMVDPEKGVAGI
jgi:hypothetical protein